MCFAGLSLGSALVMVGQRNPLYSAFALIVTICSLSAIFGLLGSPFIAALQIVVYAGAIMVLFLFVLMLLRVGREQAEPGGQQKVLKVVAIGLGALLLAQVGAVLAGAAAHGRAALRRVHPQHGARALLARSTSTCSRRPRSSSWARWWARSCWRGRNHDA